MATRRVVLLTSRSILAAGIERLLQGVKNLDLSVMQADAPDVAAQLMLAAPQVIVLDSMDAVAGKWTVSRLSREHPQARIIVLDPSSPVIRVFETTLVLETSLDGLLGAIRGRRRRHRQPGSSKERPRSPPAAHK